MKKKLYKVLTGEEARNAFAEIFEELEKDPEAKAFYFADCIVNSIRNRLRELGITQSDLARRMGVSRARVSKALSESSNLTLGTIAKIAAALEGDPKLTLTFKNPGE